MLPSMEHRVRVSYSATERNRRTIDGDLASRVVRRKPVRPAPSIDVVVGQQNAASDRSPAAESDPFGRRAPQGEETAKWGLSILPLDCPAIHQGRPLLRSDGEFGT